ncbi:MAG TPA: TolC family protein [Gemmatimonadaceae bacterium]|nr:TolC family protein [Gemmatimonadaceae bacterium]
MNATSNKAIRIGAGLSVLAALLAFAARVASAQESGPRRLSLGEAARLAASQTAAVQEAALRVSEANARVKQSRSSLLPQVDLTPSWTSHTVNSASFGFNFPAPAGEKPLLDPNGQIIGPVRFWDFRGGVSQTLINPAGSQRVRAARAGVTAASADVATAGENAASNAALSYLRALRSEAVYRARVADSTLAVDLLNVARNQLEAGVGVGLDVTRAQSQSAGARAQLIQARNDRDRAQLDLKRALNLPLDQQIILTDSLTAAVVVDTTEAAAVAQAVQHRPDIRAAEAQLEAAEQQVAATRATRLPTVNAFANTGPTGFVNHLLNTYTYGLQLSWPVFEGGRREAETEEQIAMAKEIDVRRRDLQQQATVDVRAALLDIASTREQVEAARTRQSLAELEVQQARDRFNAGVAGNADVITASVTLNAARTGLIDALASYQAARVSLAKAEGTVSQLR